MTTGSNERQSRLETVVGLSKQMLDVATNGDWQQFADLEQRRRQDMLACFEQPVDASEATAVRNNIKLLMTLNDQLTRCVQQAREESARQFQSLQQGRRAVGAYAR
ncbi:flagellar protein FliT [bacterium SCSIO 12696]|nr:flagellar protein FliT [bacterium SCSIO 12696]